MWLQQQRQRKCKSRDVPGQATVAAAAAAALGLRLWGLGRWDNGKGWGVGRVAVREVGWSYGVEG
jgi:hypothetical protein